MGGQPGVTLGRRFKGFETVRVDFNRPSQR
jgi:hypothetical protein